MATDEERLAQIRAEETKVQFTGMFKEAMDAWVAEQKTKQENEEPPKRTKQTSGGFFDTLFGGA